MNATRRYSSHHAIRHYGTLRYTYDAMPLCPGPLAKGLPLRRPRTRVPWRPACLELAGQVER